MLFPRFVGDGNENLFSASYFTRKRVKRPVSFVCEKRKGKRSFSFPSLYGVPKTNGGCHQLERRRGVSHQETRLRPLQPQQLEKKVGIGMSSKRTIVPPQTS